MTGLNKFNFKKTLTIHEKYGILVLTIGVAVFVCPKQAMSRAWSANRISYGCPKVAFFYKEKKMPKGIYKRTSKHFKQIKELTVRQKGKTFEEMYGVKKAKELKKRLRKTHLGHKASEESKNKRSFANRGCKNPNWKGGRVKIEGYIWVYTPNHPNCSSQNYVFEHRLVVEKKIGRYLQPWEVVHHINGIKDDNRPENLELLPNQGTHLSIIFLQRENKKLKLENKRLKEKLRMVKNG